MTTRNIWPMAPVMNGGLNTSNMNASGIYVGNVFAASKTGSIDRVLIPNSSITGSPPVYEVRIEALGSTMNPSGTLWSTTTNGTYTPTNGTVATVTLTSSASVTKGDLYAVCIRYSSGTIDASNFMSVLASINTTFSNGTWQVPAFVSSTNSGSSWTRTADLAPSLCPLYTDGDAEIGQYGIISTTTLIFRTTTVTHIGCKFVAPMSCECVGALYGWGQASTQARTLKLLDTSDNLLASKNGTTQNNTAQPGIVLFATPYTISAGTTYRLAFEATTTTSQSVLRYSSLSSNCRLASFGECYHTEKQSGSWTDYTDGAPTIVPLFASPSSSGSSVAFSPARSI